MNKQLLGNASQNHPLTKFLENFISLSQVSYLAQEPPGSGNQAIYHPTRIPEPLGFGHQVIHHSTRVFELPGFSQRAIHCLTRIFEPPGSGY